MSDPALTIAFQGAPGAYSDLACRTAQPAMTTLPCATFEEAFAAVLAGLAVTCQGESAIRTVGAAFPQLRPVPLEGVEPARVAVAWRNREETELTRAFVATALAVATHNRTR